MRGVSIQKHENSSRPSGKTKTYCSTSKKSITYLFLGDKEDCYVYERKCKSEK